MNFQALMRSAAEVFLGICSGGATAAGVFALISIIGIIPRMAGHTRTARHIHKYEWAVIAGGTLSNIWYFFQPTAAFLPAFCRIAELLTGLGIGMFVGSLVMALAEILQVFPIMIRRSRLRVGVMYLGLALALGKTAGAALYFMIKK